MSDTVTERLEHWFWARHSNPKSGWSRLPTGPIIVYALYRRHWRLLRGALIWTVVNPILFAPPETEASWMTRAVLAERWWIQAEDNAMIGLEHPNIANAGAVLAFGFALYTAWRQQPAEATLGTVLGVALKCWWLHVLVQWYDACEPSTSAYPRRFSGGCPTHPRRIASSISSWLMLSRIGCARNAANRHSPSSGSMRK